MNSKYTDELDLELIKTIISEIQEWHFSAIVFRNLNDESLPWVITVGEEDWSWFAHLIVKFAKKDGSDACLAILASEESEKLAFNIDTENIAEIVMLRDLIADGHNGVKKVLKPMVLSA